MELLPPHVATADEPIEDFGERPWDGPDMKRAMPIEAMLGALHQLDSDPAAYISLWMTFAKSVGGWVGLTISREGEEQLGLGRPCDAQIRHRNRWLHFLDEDLHADPERRDLLITILMEKGRYADNRPADPRTTTRAIRDFLRNQGRILIDPKGELTEGGGMPRAFAHGTSEEAAECVRASQAYFTIRNRWRSAKHIKRAVRMLGKPTQNGWLILEARA